MTFVVTAVLFFFLRMAPRETGSKANLFHLLDYDRILLDNNFTIVLSEFIGCGQLKHLRLLFPHF